MINSIATITLPKTEYQKLKAQAQAYQKVMSNFFESIIKNPIQEVVEDFKKTDLYTEEFIKDLEIGLKKSSYFQRHANTASKKGA